MRISEAALRGKPDQSKSVVTGTTVSRALPGSIYTQTLETACKISPTKTFSNAFPKMNHTVNKNHREGHEFHSCRYSLGKDRGFSR